MTPQTHTIWVAFGGNLGDVAATFRKAAMEFASNRDFTFQAISRNYETPPMGSGAGTAFLNAVARLDTSLSPVAVLNELQRIEQVCGRVRTRVWGPRTLDLDLLFYDAETVETPRLRVPHPHLWYRRFVLDPLCDLNPELRHPRLGLTMADLLSRVQQRPLPIALCGVSEDGFTDLMQTLEREFPVDCCWLSPGEPVPHSVAFGFWMAPPDLTFAPCASDPWINLTDFPTPPSEALRDVLTAALSAPRPCH